MSRNSKTRTWDTFHGHSVKMGPLYRGCLLSSSKHFDFDLDSVILESEVIS